MKSILTSMFAVLILLAAQPVIAQAGAAGDMPAAPPELVVVEKVDAAGGRIVIEGQQFEIFEGDVSLFELPPEATQRRLSLDDLSPGMEVMVITDGTETTRDRVASIIAIWRPL